MINYPCSSPTFRTFFLLAQKENVEDEMNLKDRGRQIEESHQLIAKLRYFCIYGQTYIFS